MKNLVKHLQNMNAIHKMWHDFGTLVIGVSGGPDSMCLLDVMMRIARKERLLLIVAHVNYGLRGLDALQDQELVERVAKENDLPCEVLVVDDKKNGSSEDQWRTIRYDFFEKVRRKYDADGILVAHNKNDQAETFLLHLLRGSGLTGLVGMRFVSDHHVIRPMLSVPREDIIAYCEKNNVPFRHDHTNDEVVYTRNKIRKELIPYLAEHYNKQIISVLTRTAETIAQDVQCIREKADIFWIQDTEFTVHFSARDFCERKIAIQRRALLQMCAVVCGTTKDIEKGMIDEMRKVIASTKGQQQIFASKNLKMIKKNDIVELTCRCRSL